MKYYSRSPEEWRKIDEEKRKRDRIPELRRRSWMFFFMNVILVGAVMVMIGLWRLKSSLPMSLYLKFPDTCLSGNEELLEVRLVNTRSRELEFVVEKIKLEILSPAGTSSIVMDVQADIDVEVKPYSYVVLVKKDLRFDEPGEHTLRVSVKTSLGDLEAKKTIVIKEALDLVLAGYEPYYLPGESPSYVLVVRNSSQRSKNVAVSEAKISLLERGKVIEAIRFNPVAGDVPPNSSIEIGRFAPSVVFENEGNYEVRAEAIINGKRIRRDMTFRVVNPSKVSMDGVKILLDYGEAPGGVYVSVYLTNASRYDRFFEVKNASLVVYSSDGTREAEVRGIRFWIPPSGKMLLVERVFDVGDIKGITVVVESEGKVITKKIGGG